MFTDRTNKKLLVRTLETTLNIEPVNGTVSYYCFESEIEDCNQCLEKHVSKQKRNNFAFAKVERV